MCFLLQWKGAGALPVPLWVAAQTPPSADQVTRYVDLHAAAHTGDLARLVAALAQRRDLNARDAMPRTPIHVAPFARRCEAIRAPVHATRPARSRCLLPAPTPGSPTEMAAARRRWRTRAALPKWRET
jgi:hypothetical protein